MTELHREQFRQWLEAFAPDEMVGRRIAHDQCPLAYYLWYQVGEPDRQWYSGPQVQPYEGEGFWSYQDKQHPLPQWAVQFAHKADEDGVIWCYAEENEITAQEALRLLGEVPA